MTLDRSFGLIGQGHDVTLLHADGLLQENCELVGEDVLTIQAAARHELDPAQGMLVVVGELGSVQVAPEIQRTRLGSPGWPGGQHETLLSYRYRPLNFCVLTCSCHTIHLVALHLDVHVPLGLQKVESFLWGSTTNTRNM